MTGNILDFPNPGRGCPDWHAAPRHAPSRARPRKAGVGACSVLPADQRPLVGGGLPRGDDGPHGHSGLVCDFGPMPDRLSRRVPKAGFGRSIYGLLCLDPVESGCEGQNAHEA
jgi:hypothetical protein